MTRDNRNRGPRRVALFCFIPYLAWFGDFRVTNLVVGLALPNGGPLIRGDPQVALRTPDWVWGVVTLQIFHYYSTPKKSGAHINPNAPMQRGDKSTTYAA